MCFVFRVFIGCILWFAHITSLSCLSFILLCNLYFFVFVFLCNLYFFRFYIALFTTIAFDNLLLLIFPFVSSFWCFRWWFLTFLICVYVCSGIREICVSGIRFLDGIGCDRVQCLLGVAFSVLVRTLCLFGSSVRSLCYQQFSHCKSSNKSLDLCYLVCFLLTHGCVTFWYFVCVTFVCVSVTCRIL